VEFSVVVLDRVKISKTIDMVLGLWLEEGRENGVDFGDPPFVRFVV
jgi:hypothetical protein